MTQASQEQKSSPSEVVSHGPLAQEQPIADSTSDNDANEKSAREKFKKTSIASLSKNAIPSETLLQSGTGASTPNSLRQDPPASSANIVDEVSRGRPVGKRALEDEDMGFSNTVGTTAYDPPSDVSNGHTRKRSRDVRPGEYVKANERSRDSQKDSLREEVGNSANAQKSEISAEHRSGQSINEERVDHNLAGNPTQSTLGEDTVLSEATYEASIESDRPAQVLRTAETRHSEDEEMRDGGHSPRKKRSRDQLDNEADREQKIAATEETRAQRRSEELDRSDASLNPAIVNLEKASRRAPVTASAVKISSDNQADPAKSELPKAIFGAINMIRASSGSSISKPASRALDDKESENEVPLAPNPSAFASSGFASFASSSTSPFGAVKASSTFATPNPPTSDNATVEPLNVQDAKRAEESDFGSFIKAPSAGFGNTELSPFASAGSKVGSSFGGSVFGGSFGGGFGGGNKLTSFAAPAGDAKLGSANGLVKPIGSSSNDDEEKAGSETEDEGDEDGSRNEELSEANDKFQHQDVDTGEDGEDTIFSSRGKLYSFKENNWKEAGSGVFKLNVISETPEDSQRNARFIMRAHQTYRVLLNQPIFPQMKVGDRSGNEPTGKAFAFAVIEDGKPIPHMVRLGDVSESKTLYHEVMRLRHDSIQGTRGQGPHPTAEFG